MPKKKRISKKDVTERNALLTAFGYKLTPRLRQMTLAQVQANVLNRLKIRALAYKSQKSPSEARQILKDMFRRKGVRWIKYFDTCSDTLLLTKYGKIDAYRRLVETEFGFTLQPSHLGLSEKQLRIHLEQDTRPAGQYISLSRLAKDMQIGPQIFRRLARLGIIDSSPSQGLHKIFVVDPAKAARQLRSKKTIDFLREDVKNKGRHIQAIREQLIEKIISYRIGK
jgi:hypothetical protein